MTFHEPLTPFVDRLFRVMGYEVMRINDQHTIIANKNHRKVDVYRDNKKSWNLIGVGLNVDVVNQSDMAAMTIMNLEKLNEHHS